MKQIISWGILQPADPGCPLLRVFTRTKQDKVQWSYKSPEYTKKHNPFALSMYTYSVISGLTFHAVLRPAHRSLHLQQPLNPTRSWQLPEMQAMQHGQRSGQGHKLFRLCRHVLACESLHHYVYTLSPPTSMCSFLFPVACSSSSSCTSAQISTSWTCCHAAGARSVYVPA